MEPDQWLRQGVCVNHQFGFSTVAFLVLIFSNICLGAGTFQSATSLATGGTGRAAIEPIDVISLNPAGLPHLEGRHFSFSTRPQTIAVGLSDNTPESMLPGGIAYIQKKLSDVPEVYSKDFRVSLGEFLRNQWSVGISAHYTDVKTEKKLYTQMNGDLGITYTANENLGLALVGSDLTPVSQDIPQEFRNEAKLAFGSYWIYKNFFRIRADVISNLAQKSDRLSYAAGAESYIETWMVMRAGLARDELMAESWGTLGIGFLGPRFYVNYAWEKTVASSEIVEDRNFHSIDLGIPF